MPKYPPLTNPAQLQGVTLAFEDVDVDEWQHSVRIQEMTGEELGDFRASQVELRNGKVTGLNLRTNTARLLAVTIRDPHGNRIYDDYTGPDQLLRKGAAPLERLAKIANRLSGLDEDDASAEGNSAPAPGGSANGTAPLPSADSEASFSPA